MQEIHPDEWKFYELNSQLELMDELIRKIESNLKNGLDLQYLTAESALKIMHNDFLVMQNQILSSKYKVQKQIYDRMVEEKRNQVNE